MTLQVIQFHTTHRCKTCNEIEQYTLETLKDYPEISFLLVNVDEETNWEMVEEFEAFGTSLYPLYNCRKREC